MKRTKLAASEAYDVVVVGGGPAGVCAAIQAASAGARTLLVEKNAALGGTTTVAGVDLPGLFHAWGNQVIAGIGWSLVERAVSLAGGVLPDFADFDRPHNRLQVRVNAGLYAALLDEACSEAGVTTLFHTMLADVAETASGWNLTMCGKEGLSSVLALRLIDCTGDANAVQLAGYATTANQYRQPSTLMIRLGGYDRDALDYDELDQVIADAVAGGALQPGDFATDYKPSSTFLRKWGENGIHIPGVEGATSAGRSSGEMRARAAFLRIFRLLKVQPGLEGLRVEHMAMECGVRESVTILGEESIGVADYRSGRVWADAVANSFYPIDVHDPRGNGIRIEPLPFGTVATIPRGAMIPRGSSRLIVAGRTIAGDQEANSAYRVQATCMATGQAAGALAALSVRSEVSIRDVSIAELDALLRKHGAIVPPFSQRSQLPVALESRP